jgi:hypothetical protein
MKYPSEHAPGVVRGVFRSGVPRDGGGGVVGVGRDSCSLAATGAAGLADKASAGGVGQQGFGVISDDGIGEHGVHGVLLRSFVDRFDFRGKAAALTSELPPALNGLRRAWTALGDRVGPRGG